MSNGLIPSLPGNLAKDLDDQVLENLGVKRELRREFTSWSTVSFSLSVLGCVASIASTFNTPVIYGGPAAAVWSWFLGGWGCIAIAISVAELVSAYPSSGGAYAATGYVFGPKYRKGISFVNGWITIVGQLATAASGNFAASQMIYAAVTIGTNGAFVATRGQVFGLYCGLNLLMGAYNILPIRILDRFTATWMWVNLATSLAVIIAIPAAASHHGTLAPSSFVWSQVTDGTGWNNKPFAFLLGILSVQWVMTDYDGVAHLAEEVKNAAVVAPAAIVIAVISTGFIGFWINVALCYGIRDLSALPGPTALVFAQILWDNLGRSGGLALWSFVILIQMFTGLACQLACIRSVYAVSRDGAFPDRKILSKVWPATKTPMNAAVFTVLVECLFGLLCLASYVAVNAVFSITAVALDVSYMIPSAGKLYLYFYPSSEVAFNPGPFFLGKWGYWINIYAIIWVLFETGILIMPQVRPVTSSTMNYAGPIMGGVILISGIWYQLYAKHSYQPSSALAGKAPTQRSNSDSPTHRGDEESADEKKGKFWF